jgi:isopentenyldiphosphate isomerase
MAYLDHIHACNNFDPAGYRPFMVDGRRVGWVPHDLAEALSRWPDVFRVEADGVALDPRFDDFEKRSAAVAAPARALAEDGLIEHWRGELYPVTPDWHTPPVMQMERAACPRFGIRAFGVHINGFVQKADGLHMWVARRAYDKPTFPGMLDNMVAGGQPIGLGLMANVIKECGEEAGVPEDLARQARAVGMISYTHRPPEGGCKPDQMFCYDLELPADFRPVPEDGEVDEFYLWPIAKVAETVRDSFEFKFNCNLCIIDFLVRHGVIDPDDEPDYSALVHGLRAGG